MNKRPCDAWVILIKNTQNSVPTFITKDHIMHQLLVILSHYGIISREQ